MLKNSHLKMSGVEVGHQTSICKMFKIQPNSVG